MGPEDVGSNIGLVCVKAFILAMDLLQLMLQRATEQGLLTPISSRKARMRTSLFADDAAIFVNPVRQEVSTMKSYLDKLWGGLWSTNKHPEKRSLPIQV